MGTARVVERFREVFSSKPHVVASAPGRIDFLNTHQDYKGLPVVGVGINLRCFVAAAKRSDFRVRIFSENLAREGVEHRDEFDSRSIELVGGKWFGDYVRASLKVLSSLVNSLPGFDIYIDSDVPIASGLASSAALIVAVIKALSSLLGLDLEPRKIAELAYVAEHDFMGIPCGRLDQYSSAFGGVVWIETRPPYRVQQIDFGKGVFVVLDSGIRHSTADIHPKRQREIEAGLEKLLSLGIPPKLRAKLGHRYWEPKWEELSLEELEPYLKILGEVPRKRIVFTILMHRSTILAREIMLGNLSVLNEVTKLVKILSRASDPQLAAVGAIMNYQHELLRDLYDVSLPKLEEIRNAALNAGALGCKISGAGLGGALVALCPSHKVAKHVLDAGMRAGAVRGWIVEYDQGVRLESYVLASG